MTEFSETTYDSWGGALMDSIKGVLVGGVLFLAAFPVLFMNEGCAVQTFKSLKEGKGAVVKVTKIDSVDKANDQKLVHMTGEATTKDSLTDKEFGIKVTAIRLIRKAEMFQWKEIKETKKKRRKKTTTYKYEKVWSDKWIDTSTFKKEYADKAGVTPNPQMKFKSAGVQAKKVTLGAYTLSKSLVDQIDKSEKLAFTQEMAAKLPPGYKGQFGRKLKIRDGGLYWSPRTQTGGEAQIGDTRIQWTVVKPQEVSIISQQTGDTFRPYQTKAGDPLDMLSDGNVSAEMMFKKAEEAAVMRTWLIRLGGFLMMAIGLFMIGGPLVAVVDFLPFLGDLLSVGVALFAGLVAAALSLVTIAVAWIFYRPVLGVVLLVVAVGLIVGLKKMGGKARAAG